jgi:hypothetical protein
MVALAGLPLGTLLSAQVGFVNLDDAAQQSVLALHHAADALAEEPRRLLTDAEMLAQLDRRDALAARRHQVERREPDPHRQVRALQRGAHRRREHGAARMALPVMRAGLLLGCCSDTAALAADRTGRPAHGLKMTPTGIVIGKPGKEWKQ